MKDQKPFIIGLGLGVLIIAGIALSKPKQSKEATAPSTSKPSQAAAKPEPNLSRRRLTNLPLPNQLRLQ